ncbi:hypothetical protein CSB93_2331 [Pseudomonas paraeruginosa]|uniref:Uncharacterized protein n=1 Tax=Pseudomonas paraeruginosa TaxID=2994495 RepID=A0A2R3IQS7_9PSED|nr:hypothetical protein CSB93_2331 [Pseudomonas paraeruginosa]AWE95126.1 hypothetical protein CSC28_1098 [Pseudomonas paraeruginosa]
MGRRQRRAEKAVGRRQDGGGGARKGAREVSHHPVSWFMYGA